MRTTLTLRDETLAEARRIAAEKHTTVSAVVDDLVTEALLRREAPRETRRRVILPVAPMPTVPGLQPGVNIDSNAELLEIMDEDLDIFGGKG
jgi:hypothetical protein